MSKSFLIFFLLFVLMSPFVHGGYTWVNPIRLTWNTSTSSHPVAIEDSLNRVHIIWSDKSGLKDLYYKRSTNGGANWGPLQQLTWTGLSDTLSPSLTVDSNNVLHLVYEEDIMVDCEIYYKKSTDGGQNWSAPVRLTWNTGYSMNPSICVDSTDNIYVLWQDDTPGDSEIYFKCSTNGGGTWSSLQRLTWNSRDSSNPRIKSSAGSTLHIVWHERLNSTNYEIYYKKSTNGGMNWNPPTRLTWTSNKAMYPEITVEPAGNIHVAWEYGDIGDKEIYYKQSLDDGNTWSTVSRLTWMGGESRDPTITADVYGTIAIAWNDDNSGNYDIYYKESTDNGQTWTPLDRITWTSGSTWKPFLGTGPSGALHLVYTENSAGNYEIFHKKRLVTIPLESSSHNSIK